MLAVGISRFHAHSHQGMRISLCHPSQLSAFCGISLPFTYFPLSGQKASCELRPTNHPNMQVLWSPGELLFWGITPQRLSRALYEEVTLLAEGCGLFHSRSLECCRGLCQELGRICLTSLTSESSKGSCEEKNRSTSADASSSPNATSAHQLTFPSQDAGIWP